VNAAIENAHRIQNLRSDYGSFKGWLDSHHPQSLESWTKLFKRTFTFTDGEIVKEFLMSTGYLPGAHTSDCPIHEVVALKRPAWISR
jgi:DNA-3-methyladenine glycosylase I